MNKTLRNADDTVLLTDSLEDLQHRLDPFIEVAEEYGVKLNTNKTKYMVITKNDTNVVTRLYANNTVLERLKGLIDLGSLLNDQWDHIRKIRQRLKIACTIFIKMRDMFSSNTPSLSQRMRIYVKGTQSY